MLLGLPRAMIMAVVRALFTGSKPAKFSQSLASKLSRSLVSGKQVQFTKAEVKQVRAFAKDKSRSKQITPNVDVRTDYYPNVYTGKAGALHMVDYKKLPMVDLDLPASASHMASQVRYKSYESAMRGVDKYLKSGRGKESVFDIYSTPAGLRMFDLGRRQSPLSYATTADKIGSDPLYQAFSLQRGKFGARVSPKPGRAGDFVARPIHRAYGEGKIITDNFRELKIHDNLIDKIQKTETVSDVEALSGLLEMTFR